MVNNKGRDNAPRLFFLRDAQPAGLPMPFKGCVLANITGRGTCRGHFRPRGWRLPE